MTVWIYFIHPPREDFAATMSDAEQEVWGRHWTRLQAAFAEGFARGELRPFHLSLLRGS